MTDLNHYIPRCKTCGVLNPPTHIENAIQACNIHRFNHPNHKTMWVPIKSARNNKEQSK
ncbi:hypothetical protein PT279_09145 [Bifidobacterium sp. ESL0784]|uniref:hypothetical protein n=1 Tax=Bifidobacterium sp. ESL0784 TaxID=2983231 RepID=UPI0023FA2EF3|nr:hypothetical protein [Bifidobacterium sp. ESL0784]MDF7641748.1 hypothetical protein [Bifidobacterium sp. ESL0784]